MKYGLMVDEERKAAKISLRGLARAAEISPTYLSHIMAGLVPPPKSDKVVKVARALGQDPERHLRVAGRWEEHALSGMERSSIRRSVLEIVFAMQEDELQELLREIRSKRAPQQQTGDLFER